MSTPQHNAPIHAVILAHQLVLEGGGRFSPAMIAQIRRTLRSLSGVGIQHICIVDGERADELANQLDFAELSANVVVRSNPSWRQASGAALLAVADFVESAVESASGSCLVVPGDKPLDSETLAELCHVSLNHCDAAIVVNPRRDDTMRTDDVRVRLAGRRGRVAALGLDLDRFDSVFTGHALITHNVLADLRQLEDTSQNPMLADGLNTVLQQGQVRAITGQVATPWAPTVLAEVAESVDAILETKAHPHYTLLNPGPVNTTARVKSAMVHHDVCHRDANFSELMVSLTNKLRRIFRGSAAHTVCMITGSGTAAMESSISSAVPRDGKILVIDNGAFGERVLEIAKLHEMDIVHLRYPWGDQVQPRDIRRALEANPDIAVVAMPHHETSVGLLNPIREVGRLCREHDALFIVDAVSSLGAEDIDVVRDNIDICFSSANKCLHAISGAGFVCVAPRAWEKIEHIKPRSFYLDLKRYRRYQEDLAQTPFTPAVSAYFALEAACDEFLADGHVDRLAGYRQRNQVLREGLSRLGMAPLTRTGNESHSVVTVCVPDGIAFNDLYTELKDRGYIIYGCKDVLAGRFFQVANMGDLSIEQLDIFLRELGNVIAKLSSTSADSQTIANQRAIA